jgi:DNA-binding GntR family transcriptional regulator
VPAPPRRGGFPGGFWRRRWRGAAPGGGGGGPAPLTDLEAEARRLEEITAAGDLEQAAVLNRRFHHGIAELAGNPIAVEILDRLWNQITVSTRASLAPSERPDAVAAEHRELLAAIAGGDRARAGQIAGRHASATAHVIGEAPSGTKGA